MQTHTHIYSFFSGAGFLDLGFEKSGFTIAFVNEFHKPFLNAYHHARRIMKIPEPFFGYSTNSVEDFLFGDMRNLLIKRTEESKRLVPLIGFIAGPPCPDFSVGGKNLGHNGERGRLTATYFALIQQIKPDFFIFENVKGLWKTRKHREFYEQMKIIVQNDGYITTEKVINSLDFGVPQDRERIILFGISKRILPTDISYSRILPENLFPWNRYTLFSKKELDNLPWPTISPFIQDSISECPDGIPQELTVEYWFQKNEVNNHANSGHYFKPKAGLPKFMQIPEGDDSKKSYKRLHRWRYSPTAAYGNNEVHLHPYKARRLTATEAMAIQSLPKEFQLPADMTLSNMFKTIGNGVPFLAAQGVAHSIMDFLGDYACL